MMEENQQYTSTWRPKPNAPYAVSSLVLGISSLVVSGLGITLVLGILGLIFSNKGLNEYNEHPDQYVGDGMLRAGKVTSIIGIVLSGIALIAIVFILIIAVGAIIAAGTMDL